MKKQDFEKIIKPLYLLNEVERKFMIDALQGNFDKWEQGKVKNIGDRNVLCTCGLDWFHAQYELDDNKCEHCGKRIEA